MRRAVWMLTGLLGSSIACTQSSDVVFGETSGGPGNTSGGVTSSSGSVNNGSGGGSSGSEPTTPPHCGDPNVPKCADGEVVALPGAPVLSDGLPVDRSFEVPAPGRFPLGAGPFGHADLLGIAETMVLDGAQLKMVRQYAFQEAYYGVVTYGTLYNMRNYTSHYAVAARCSRPL